MEYQSILINQYGIPCRTDNELCNAVAKAVPLYKKIAEKTKRDFWSKFRIEEWSLYYNSIDVDCFDDLDQKSKAIVMDTLENEIRKEYAFAVGRSLCLKGYPLKMFVYFRMHNMWRWTKDTTVTLYLYDKLKQEGGGGLKVRLKDLENLYHYGMKTGKMVHLYNIVVSKTKEPTLATIPNYVYKNSYLQNTGVYKPVINTYEFFSKICASLRGRRGADIETFLRIFKVTANISSSLVPARYERVLATLNNRVFFLTLTDTRNWSNNNDYQLNVFRLKNTVTSYKEWQPIREYHKIAKSWLVKLGRIPKINNVFYLNNEVISSISKKGLNLLCKTVQQLGIEEDKHSIIALSRLILNFGLDYNNYVEACGCSIHDAGIELPDYKLEHKKVRFLIKNSANHRTAQNILINWDLLEENGINPLSKGGFEEAVSFLQVLKYTGVKNISIAEECAKFYYTQDMFEVVQDLWINKVSIYSCIPKVVLNDGDWKFYTLSKDDFRGPFLGEYTHCCQHPGGAGETCAKHGAIDDNGGFVVLEYRGKITYQSWVWRLEDTLVFDNIEGRVSNDLVSKAKQIYLTGMSMFAGRLCIKNVLLGKGNTKLSYYSILEDGEPLPTPTGCYSDSDKRVWRVV